MSHTNPYLPGCGQCGNTTVDLVEKCPTCQVASYCNSKCKALNASEHRPGCGAVARAQKKREGILKKYRSTPEYQFLVDPSSINNEIRGFDDSSAVPDFMSALTALTNALQSVHTRQAAEERVRYLRDMSLFFERVNVESNKMRLVIGLYLRMGKDKECYQFIASAIERQKKQELDDPELRASIAQEDMGDLNQLPEYCQRMRIASKNRQSEIEKEQNNKPPPFDPENINLLKDMELLDPRRLKLSHGCYEAAEMLQMMVALIKFRVLQDLKSVSVTTGGLGTKAPQDILDDFLPHRMSSNLTVDLLKRLDSEEDLQKAIANMTEHIDALFIRVGLRPWGIFFDPICLQQEMSRLANDDSACKNGSAFHRACLLDAFTETRGAEEYFRELLDKRRALLEVNGHS